MTDTEIIETLINLMESMLELIRQQRAVLAQYNAGAEFDAAYSSLEKAAKEVNINA